MSKIAIIGLSLILALVGVLAGCIAQPAETATDWSDYWYHAGPELIYNRLVSLAISPEAKSYVGVFWSGVLGWDIASASEAKAILSTYSYPDGKYICDHWEGAGWMVYQDGMVVPQTEGLGFGSGLEVEADIERLNRGETLPFKWRANTTYTAEWAEAQVWAYLNSLATGPDAIRYLAELTESGSFTSRFYESEVGQNVAGHKYSGWTVYYEAKPFETVPAIWGNLNWAVCEDGYVTEGSNDALRLKADLIELCQ